MKIHKSLGLIFLAGCCWNNGWTAPLPPASSQSNDTELTLKTSKRTLGKEYPVPPTITVKGSDFTAELNGKKTHFVRPLVAAAPRLKPSAGGKVIYVSPNGTGNGGKNSPMGSIQEAVDQAGPGDMVVINQGEYVEAVKITKSGREGAPIVITAAPGALPRIILPFGKKSHEESFSLGVVSLHGCGYVWIQGLVLEGDLHRSDSPETWGEKYGACGIVLSNGAGEGVRISNCISYWNSHCGFKEMGHGGAHFIFEGNIAFWSGNDITDHGFYIPSSDATIRGNLTFEIVGYGIHVYPSPKRLNIEKNLCINMGAGGICLAGSFHQVINNTCVGNKWGIVFYSNTSTNNVVEGNISVMNKVDIMQAVNTTDPAPTGNHCDYNDVHVTKLSLESEEQAQQYTGKHDIDQNPQFVNEEKGDYRLGEKSPARGAGKPGADGKRTNMGAF